MRKFALILLFLSFNLPAQLYVDPAYYVYVNNQVLFVQQGVELVGDATYTNANNGNIYLRNEAQFIQGNAASANTGKGELSVFQEGAASRYTYNYWSSPIRNHPADPADNFRVTQFFDPSAGTIFNPTAANFLPFGGGLNGSSTPLTIASRWLYTFTSANNYSQWTYAGTANGIAPGLGFTMKGTDNFNQQYDFRGRPNNGTIDVDIAADQFTLVGNPYPSAIDLAQVLLDADNSDVLAEAHFWEQDATINSHNIREYRGGYGVWVPGTTNPADPGTYNPPPYDNYDGNGNQIGTGAGTLPNVTGRRYTPIGQGFMVMGATGIPAGSQFTFKNVHRVYETENTTFSQFNKAYQHGKATNNPNPERKVMFNNGWETAIITEPLKIPTIRINTIVNNTFARPLTLAFRDSASPNFERGMDGSRASDLKDDSYFVIDEKKYAIQSTDFNLEQKIPFGFISSGNTSFTVTVGKTEYLDEAFSVFLFDADENTYTDIVNSKYTATLPKGEYNNRFFITFKEDNTLSNNELPITDFGIFQNNQTKQLVINNPKNHSITQINLYDVTGKLLIGQNRLNSNSRIQIETGNLATGVYVVKLQTDSKQSITQKVIVKN